MNSTSLKRAAQKRRKTRRRIAAGSVLAALVVAGVIWHQSSSAPKTANDTTHSTKHPGSGASAKSSTTGASNPKMSTSLANTNTATKSNETNTTSSTPVSASATGPLPTSKLLSVAPQSQLPQLPNGCEVTSLSMLLSAVGHPTNKMTLAQEMPKDPTKRVYGPHGTTVFWGNPNVGFVGSVYQYANGFGIYHGPITKFINQLLPGRAEDLTGKPFSDILSVVAQGTPVLLWTTATFQPTNMWTSWNTPEGPIKVTLQEHAVLLVGYNQTQLFVNNPLNGEKAQAVNRQQFLEAWKQLGDQAVTILPAAQNQ